MQSRLFVFSTETEERQKRERDSERERERENRSRLAFFLTLVAMERDRFDRVRTQEIRHFGRHHFLVDKDERFASNRSDFVNEDLLQAV